MVTLYVQFFGSDWSKFDRWDHAENLCSILKLVYFDSWGWQSFLSTCDVFNCLFPLSVQNEIQLLSRDFCYLWLVCLLGFWLRTASLVKVGNPISDDIVFIFHLAWCVRGFKNLKRIWPYLIAFRSCTWVIIVSDVWFFISNFMKPRTVYAASLCTFVRFESMIWPSIRLRIFRDTLILVFVNENCYLCKWFTELYFFYWLLVVFLVILIAVPFVFSCSWTPLAGVLIMPRESNAFQDYTSDYTSL